MTAPDESVWRPVGPRAEGECACSLIDDPDEMGPCTIRPSWRITVSDGLNSARLPDGIERGYGVVADAITYLACVVHLASVITLMDGSYGGPVLVEVHHG